MEEAMEETNQASLPNPNLLHDDPFHSLPLLYFLPKSVPNPPKTEGDELEILHGFLRSKSARCTEIDQEEANKIIHTYDGELNIEQQRQPHSVLDLKTSSVPQTRDQLMLANKENDLKQLQSKHPDLVLNKSRRPLKSIDSNSNSVDAKCSDNKLDDPEEYFAAFERLEKAEEMAEQSQVEIVAPSVQENRLANRVRKPGILGNRKQTGYEKYFADAAADSRKSSNANTDSVFRPPIGDNPEEFFAAYERHQRASEVLKKLSRKTTSHTRQEMAPPVKRIRRPGLLGRRSTYDFSADAGDVAMILSPKGIAGDAAVPSNEIRKAVSSQDYAIPNTNLDRKNSFGKSPGVDSTEGKPQSRSEVAEVGEKPAKMGNVSMLSNLLLSPRKWFEEHMEMEKIDMHKIQLPNLGSFDVNVNEAATFPGRISMLQSRKSPILQPSCNYASSDERHISSQNLPGKCTISTSNLLPTLSKSPLAAISRFTRYFSRSVSKGKEFIIDEGLVSHPGSSHSSDNVDLSPAGYMLSSPDVAFQHDEAKLRFAGKLNVQSVRLVPTMIREDYNVDETADQSLTNKSIWKDSMLPMPGSNCDALKEKTSLHPQGIATSISTYQQGPVCDAPSTSRSSKNPPVVLGTSAVDNDLAENLSSLKRSTESSYRSSVDEDNPASLRATGKQKLQVEPLAELDIVNQEVGNYEDFQDGGQDSDHGLSTSANSHVDKAQFEKATGHETKSQEMLVDNSCSLGSQSSHGRPQGRFRGKDSQLLANPLVDQEKVAKEAVTCNNSSTADNSATAGDPNHCAREYPEKANDSSHQRNGEHQVDIRPSKRTKIAARKVSARRKSLIDAGLEWKGGVRRSKRIKTRPLEYWRGERFLYGRIHNSLATVIGIKCSSPTTDDPRKLKVKSFVSDKYSDLLEMAASH